MLKTIQLVAGVMGGLWGLGASLYWWGWVLSTPAGHMEGNSQVMGLSALMGGLSLVGLVGSVLSARKPITKLIIPLWAGVVLLLVAVGVTVFSLGILYIPAVLLLLIASILATVRCSWWPNKISRWMELGIGGGGGVLGIATTGLLLATNGSSAGLQTDVAMQQVDSAFPLQAETARVLFRLLMGSLALATLAIFVLRTWWGSRRVIAVLWGTAGGLLMGSMVGFFMGGFVYLPAALLVVIGSFITTFWGVTERSNTRQH